MAPDASAETIARLTAQQINARQPHSRLYYRIRATRQLTGGEGRLGDAPTLADPRDSTSRPISALSTLSRHSAVPTSRLSIIQFAAQRYAVSEADGHCRLKVRRSGRTARRVLFKYETMDGTALAGKDYISQSETLVFNPNEVEKTISVSLIADAEKEPDEIFYVKLGAEDASDGTTLIGESSVATVTITDSDKETKVQMGVPAMVVKENAGSAHVPVIRRGNTHSALSVAWRTVDGSATEGKDYIGGHAQLRFEPGEIEKWIELPIVDDKDFEKHESFEVQLTEVAGDGTLNQKKRRTVVTILNDDEMTLLLTQSDKLIPQQLASLQPGHQTWAEQIRCAVNVNGGDLASASRADYVIHVISFGWKLVFSLVPPPHIAAGWLTFFVALALIGLLTAIVGDIAGIFGCLVGLEDSITAITLVALGTSLPDLFASKLAAQSEDTADNSIGNVTGSNCVNVFLGLGLSWLMGALYQEGKGGVFTVQAGSLAFSVTVYTIVSVLCLALLAARRRLPLFGQAELGGPSGPKWICAIFLVALWLLYVILSSLQAVGYIQAF